MTFTRDGKLGGVMVMAVKEAQKKRTAVKVKRLGRQGQWLSVQACCSGGDFLDNNLQTFKAIYSHGMHTWMFTCL